MNIKLCAIRHQDKNSAIGFEILFPIEGCYAAADSEEEIESKVSEAVSEFLDLLAKDKSITMRIQGLDYWKRVVTPECLNGGELVEISFCLELPNRSYSVLPLPGPNSGYDLEICAPRS